MNQRKNPLRRTLVTMAFGLSGCAALAQGVKIDQSASRLELRPDKVMGQVVVDNQTKLIWMYCLVGQVFKDGDCQGESQQVTWYEAASLQKSVGGGWRLPYKNELLTLRQSNGIDYSFIDPMLKRGNDWIFWTATEVGNMPNTHWVVAFENRPIMYGGSPDTRENTGRTWVRLVRSK